MSDGSMSGAKSPLVLAIEAQTRASVTFDVAPLLGIAGPKLVAVRLLTVGETEDAQLAAHAHLAARAKQAKDGEAVAARDQQLAADAHTVEALWRVCRQPDPNDASKPGQFGAFPGPDWMRANLRPDQLGALFNLYLEVRAKKSSSPVDLGDEATEAIVTALAEHLGDELPEAALAGFPREYLTHLLVMISDKFVDTREARDNLLEERDRLLADLEAARAAQAQPGPNDEAEGG